MILTKRVQLGEEDFTTAEQHPDNTILVVFEGHGAAKTPLAQIQEFLLRLATSQQQTLHKNDLTNHYRTEEACKVYFPLPQRFDRQTIHGKALTNDGITYRAFIPDRIPTKVFLAYVPPTISDTGLKKLTSTFIETDKIHHHHRHVNGRLDRHLIITELNNITDVPHFIDITDERTQKTHRILVTIPGRLPHCAQCGGPGHYANQCGNKTPPPPTTETTPLPTEMTQKQQPAQPPKESTKTETATKRPHETAPDDSPKQVSKRKQTHPKQTLPQPTTESESSSTEPEVGIHTYSIPSTTFEEFCLFAKKFDVNIVSVRTSKEHPNRMKGNLKGTQQNIDEMKEKWLFLHGNPNNESYEITFNPLHI